MDKMQWIEKISQFKNNLFIQKVMSKKTLVVISILILIVSLIPLLWISFYNVPSADDFNYSVYTMNVLNHQGIGSFLSGIGKMLITTYQNWQGTYSAIVLMALQPSVWGIDSYFLGTFILIGMFLFSNYFLLKQIVTTKLKLSTSTLWLIFSLITFISIQTMPSPVQGLYWWNGASYYTLFYSFFLIELGLLCRLQEKNKKYDYIFICLCIIFIAGGNYVTALQQVIFLFFLNVYMIWKKKDKSKILFFVLAILGLLINAFAPGNAVRAASVSGYSPIMAILLSFQHAIELLLNWTTLYHLLFILAIVVLCIPSYKKINYSFSYPAIFTLLTFGIFSASMTPSLFAQGGIGEGRLINIIYFSYFYFMAINIYYWIGWFRFQCVKHHILNPNNTNVVYRKFATVLLCFFIILVGLISASNWNQYTSVKSYHSLEKGEAKQYKQEAIKRFQLLEGKHQNVVLPQFTVYPELLFYADISSDPNHWINIPLAQIYHKKSVKLEQ